MTSESGPCSPKWQLPVQRLRLFAGLLTWAVCMLSATICANSNCGFAAFSTSAVRPGARPPCLPQLRGQLQRHSQPEHHKPEPWSNIQSEHACLQLSLGADIRFPVLGPAACHKLLRRFSSHPTLAEPDDQSVPSP